MASQNPFNPIFQRLRQEAERREEGPDNLAGSTLQLSDSLARDLLGIGADEEIPDRFRPAVQGARPRARPTESVDRGNLENWWDDIRYGGEMFAAGLGELAETTGQNLPALFSAFGWRGDTGEVDYNTAHGILVGNEETQSLFAKKMEEYGERLRKKSMEDLATIGERDPENLADEVVMHSLRMLPISAGALVGSAVSGVAGAGALAGAMGASYFPEKAFLKTSLEDQGVSEEDAEVISAAGAIPIAAMEGAWEAMVAGRLGRVMPGMGFLDNSVRRTVAQRLASIAKAGFQGTVVEGLTEGAQEVIGSAIEKQTVEGRLPTFEELAERAIPAARAGALGGGGIGTVIETGAQALELRPSTRRSQKAEETRREFVKKATANFDPDAIEPGTIFDNAGWKKLANGSWQKRNEKGVWNFASKDDLTSETIKEIVEAETNAAILASQTEAATTPPERGPLNISVTDAAEKVSALIPDQQSDASVTELNIRNVAADYLEFGAASKVVQNRSDVELDALMTDLQAIALDPNNDASPADRITAMGRRRAIEIERTRSKGSHAIDAIDATIGARTFARMDDDAFEFNAASIEAEGDEATRRMLRLARSMRARQDDLIDATDLQERLAGAATARARGLGNGARVVMPDGNIGTVLEQRKNGVLDVVLDDSDSPVPVNPENIRIVPEVGQLGRLDDGQVVEIEDISGTNITVRLPDDTQASIPISEYDPNMVSGVDAATAQLSELRQQQAAEAGVEARTTLPQPITVVNNRSGQQVEITEAGERTVRTASGEILQRADISPVGGARRISEMTSPEDIPTFEAGTQPSEEGYHINFLQIPEDMVEMFERVATQGGTRLSDFLRNLPENAGLYLFPQPQKPGTRLYAIELPGDARTPTDAAKRALGVISGKENKITRSTLLSRVRLDRLLQPEEVGILRVPEALRAAANGATSINKMNLQEKRAYMRRLLDLGFDIPTEVGEKLAEVAEKAEETQQAVIEGDVGRAEVAEIETRSAQMETVQLAVEDEARAINAAWDGLRERLLEALSPRERSRIEALNMTDAKALQKIPQIGPQLAARIVEARPLDGFGTWEDAIEVIRDLKGVGPQVVENIRDYIQGNDIRPGSRIAGEHEAAVKEALQELPAREAGEAVGLHFAFPHPDIPGATLVIDKDVVHTERQDVAAGVDILIPEDIVRYHLRVVFPDGSVRDTRTLTPNEGSNQLLVPQHFTEQTRQGIPLGLVIAQQRLEEGATVDEIIEEMLDDRKKVRIVNVEGYTEQVAVLEGGAEIPLDQTPEGQIDRLDDVMEVPVDLEVVSESDGSMVVRDPRTDETFQIDASEVTEEVGRREERNGILTLPIRTTENEVLNEVVRQINRFDRRVQHLGIGQWASDSPNIYGEIRPLPEGFRAIIMREPSTRTLRRPRLFNHSYDQTFQTREEAEAWLRERGFERIEGRYAERFNSLPSVEDLAVSDLQETHDQLARLLEEYRMIGYLPQPVRDYSVRFAIKWYQQGMGRPSNGGLFYTRKIRRMLNLFEVRDARQAAQTGDPAAIPNVNVQDITVEHGNIIVPSSTAEQDASRTRVLDGILLSENLGPTDQRRLERAKKIFEQVEHDTRFLDLAAADTRNVQERLVDVDGRLGIVVDPKIGKPDSVVQVIVEGQPELLTVPKGRITRVRNKDKALAYTRAAMEERGDMASMPATPEMGFSPYDTRLGLDNITDRVQYLKGLRRRIARVYEEMQVAEDGNLTGDVNQIEVLRDAWIRMKELGINNQALPEELDGIQDDFQEVYGELVASQGSGTGNLTKKTPLIPSVLISTAGRKTRGTDGMGPVVKEAYEELANTFSNVSAYGDVMAKAKLGLISRRQRKQIDEQAKEFDLDTDLPLYQKVEYLMGHAWDPTVADYLYQMRREVGALIALNDGALPDIGIEFRMPAMGSMIKTSAFGAAITTPREMADRHYTMKYFHLMSTRARTLYGNKVKDVRELLAGLMSRDGIDLEAREQVWDLLENPDLGEAMSRPSEVLSRRKIEEVLGKENLPTGFNWYEQYRLIRELLVWARRENIRNSLFRGFKAVEITPGETTNEKLDTQKLFGRDNNLKKEEARELRRRLLQGEKIYDLDRRTSARNQHPDSEIKAFLDLTDQYHNLSEIPEDIQATMKPWMIEEFDFWARYGIHNYAPHVITGRHMIFEKTPEGEQNRLVAFTTDGTTAQEFFFRVHQGKIPQVDRNAELYVEYGPAISDYDTDIAMLGPKKWARGHSAMVKELGGPDGRASRAMRAFYQTARIGREPAMPKNLHAEARTSDLAQTIEDPYERILFYTARTARNNFLLDIENAYETARELDDKFSRATGMEPFFEHTVARKYITDLRDSFLGKEGATSKAISHALAVVTSLDLKPLKRKIHILKKRMADDPDYDMFSDPTFMEFVHSQDYAAQQWANRMTAFSSMVRLGLNPAAAAFNSLQHTMTTAPELVFRGYGTVESWKYSNQGMLDAIRYWREVNHSSAGQRSEFGQELADYAHDVGVKVQPARGIGGVGLSIVNLGQNKPVHFSDAGVLEKLNDNIEWISMMPFNSAETFVRLASAFSTKRAAEAKGLDWNESLAFSRSIIDNTQFQYYDQALPPSMRGSVARILFQFKPFLINAIKFEKDMLRAMAGGVPGVGRLPFARAGTARGAKRIIQPGTGKEIPAHKAALNAWLNLNAARFVLGGGQAVLMAPIWTPLNVIMQATLSTTLPDLALAIFGEGEERMKEQVGIAVGDPELLEAKKLALYGIGGLADIYAANRIGVSGLDLMPNNIWDFLGGPSGALFLDTYDMLLGENGYVKSQKGGAETLFGMGLGMAAAVSGYGRYPFASLVSGLSLTQLASLKNRRSLLDFIRTSEKGQTWRRSVSPTMLSNVNRTIQIFANDGLVHDPDGDRLYPSTLNRAFEATTSTLGFQPIREAEQRALYQYMFGKEASRRALRSNYLAQAAFASERSTAGYSNPEVQEILSEAAKFGIFITPDEIERAVERAQMSPAERVMSRLSDETRDPSTLFPSGTP